MKPWIWLRITSILLVVFFLGHALGGMNMPSRGAEEQAVFQAMQGYRFEAMGFTRTHWEFYRGFGHFLSVALLLLAVLTWQLAALSKTHPRQVRSFVVVLLLGNAAFVVLSWFYFFTAPGVVSTLAVLSLAIALISFRGVSAKKR